MVEGRVWRQDGSSYWSWDILSLNKKKERTKQSQARLKKWLSRCQVRAESAIDEETVDIMKKEYNKKGQKKINEAYTDPEIEKSYKYCLRLLSNGRK